jgi:hypothetical protein
MLGQTRLGGVVPGEGLLTASGPATPDPWLHLHRILVLKPPAERGSERVMFHVERESNPGRQPPARSPLATPPPLASKVVSRRLDLERKCRVKDGLTAGGAFLRPGTTTIFAGIEPGPFLATQPTSKADKGRAPSEPAILVSSTGPGGEPAGWGETPGPQATRRPIHRDRSAPPHGTR